MKGKNPELTIPQVTTDDSSTIVLGLDQFADEAFDTFSSGLKVIHSDAETITVGQHKLEETSSGTLFDFYGDEFDEEVAAPPVMKNDIKLNHFEKKEKDRAQKDPQKLKAFKEKMQKKAALSFQKKVSDKLHLFDKEKWSNPFLKTYLDSFTEIQKEDADEIDALTSYSSDNYTLINKGFRQGAWKNGDKPSVVTSTASKLLRALNNKKSVAPSDVKVRRDMNMEGLMKMLGLRSSGNPQDDAKTLLSMDHLDDGTRILCDKAVLSTTLHKEGADKFNERDVECRMLLPKGTHCLYIAPISIHMTEAEVLVQARTKHRLLKVERKNPPADLPIVVYMEAIPENEYPVDKIEELEKGTKELEKRGK